MGEGRRGDAGRSSNRAIEGAVSRAMLWGFDAEGYPPHCMAARRLKKKGTLRIALRYTINYFWTIFGKAPYTAEYTDIRERTDAKVAVEHKC